MRHRLRRKDEPCRPLRAALLAALLACAAEPLREVELEPASLPPMAVIRDMCPASRLATSGFVGARVVAIDGVPLADDPTAIEIAPGRHEFRIDCRWLDRAALVETSAELFAGRWYVIAVGVDAHGAPDALIVEVGR